MGIWAVQEGGARGNEAEAEAEAKAEAEEETLEEAGQMQAFLRRIQMGRDRVVIGSAGQTVREQCHVLAETLARNGTQRSTQHR